MEFKQETGAIISIHDDILGITDGNPGSVDFPSEQILAIHKANPGFIYKLTHVHPPGNTELSNLDKSLMRNLAYSFYPFPVRLGIVTEFIEEITEFTYLGLLEPKEKWESRGKGERVFSIDLESSLCLSDMPKSSMNWVKKLIERSYGK
jgi:hypothetical protein